MTNVQFATRGRVLTIGHSRHSMERFLKLLQAHQVTAIADVRSTPHSRTDHFCQAPLRIALEQAGVRYAYLGKELGARRDEPECYVDGQAVYDRVAKLPAFAAGIERLRRGAERFCIALMCAEKEPLDCHRTVLISRFLALAGWRVEHILADGALEPQADTDRRLVKQMGIARSLFEPELGWEDLVARAYAARASELAYRAADDSPPSDP